LLSRVLIEQDGSLGLGGLCGSRLQFWRLRRESGVLSGSDLVFVVSGYSWWHNDLVVVSWVYLCSRI
jgi:hypothetical protein